MKKLFVLCGAALFFTQGIMAQPVVINSSPISLGIMNGDVVNGVVKIEKALSNPVVLSVMQKELKLPLSALFVNNAILLKSQQNEVTFRHHSPIKNGQSMKAQVSLGLWLDGHRVNLVAKQEGSTIKLIIPGAFKLLELRVIKPVELYLPKNYRGEFKFNLDIEGQSN
ncbi:DUF5462 family protein [Aliivibrio fischeri]|uniref:DUF5462 family protein n=1 Tax=Aliivibrio fischeri TaxID=668 RepID=UPI00080E7EE9|nr:DUF5462 family protein [Aliivibrio fischeri]OCH43068.1 hypothetical protein A6D99_00370 [Aliivibrio fischeri]